MQSDNTPKKCNRPECNNPAAPHSEFCSNKCKELVAKEMESAPYGDIFHYPMYPAT